MLTTTHAQETVENTTGSPQSSTIINTISIMDQTTSSLQDEDHQTGKCVFLFITNITRGYYEKGKVQGVCVWGVR